MQCPRCNTNIYGTVAKCPACGCPLFNDTLKVETKNEKVKNGILDLKDMEAYTENIELYKKKNKEPNIFIPIVLILSVVIILIIIAIIKML